jgi:hypothetical protein
VSVKEMFVNVVPPGLFNVMTSKEVPPDGMVDGTKTLATVGGAR